MKIKSNLEIKKFFKRCLNNLYDDRINSFINLEIDPKEEAKIQTLLHKAKVHEFLKDKASWPSLFINIEDYKKTPYHANIKLNKIVDNEFEYNNELLAANILYNVSSLVFDPNKELMDSLVLRAFDKPYETTILKQNDTFWMSDTPQEANTIDPYAKKAFGNTLTFGLGIGYFIYMALLNQDVTSITIIEKNIEVIKMFKKYLLPQFIHQDKIKIIHGDAFDYFNKDFISQFDYTFVDIWQNDQDGFEIINSLLEQYLPEDDKVDFWIETTCFGFLPSMIMMYFKNLSENKKVTHEDELIDRIYQKIAAYFDSIDKCVEDVAILKDYMYDTKVHRKILALKIDNNK